VKRVADDDADDGELARQPGDGAEIIPAISAHFKREHRLCGQAELIGDSDTDALCADIESKIAGRHRSKIRDEG